MTRIQLHALMAAILYAGDAEQRHSAEDERDHPQLSTKPYRATVTARELLDDVDGMALLDSLDRKGNTAP